MNKKNILITVLVILNLIAIGWLAIYEKRASTRQAVLLSYISGFTSDDQANLTPERARELKDIFLKNKEISLSLSSSRASGPEYEYSSYGDSGGLRYSGIATWCENAAEMIVDFMVAGAINNELRAFVVIWGNTCM